MYVQIEECERKKFEKSAKLLRINACMPALLLSDNLTETDTGMRCAVQGTMASWPASEQDAVVSIHSNLRT